MNATPMYDAIERGEEINLDNLPEVKYEKPSRRWQRKHNFAHKLLDDARRISACVETCYFSHRKTPIEA